MTSKSIREDGGSFYEKFLTLFDYHEKPFRGEKGRGGVLNKTVINFIKATMESLRNSTLNNF